MVTMLAGGRGQVVIKGKGVTLDWEQLVRKAAERNGQQFADAVEGIVRERPADLDTRVEATKKAFRAISDKLSIFISYKRAQHAQAATKLHNILQLYGSKDVDVFLDTSSLAYGKVWYDKIGERLKEANCFILLVPDDTDERKWPIFETGYFAGQMLPGERLICLHHENTPVPKQVEIYHSTKANKEDIENLLNDIIVNEDFIYGLGAINPNSKENLSSDAAEIASLFAEPLRLIVRHTMNFVTLRLAVPGILADMRDLLSATILDGRGLNEIFSYNGAMNVPFGDVLLVEDNSLKRHEDWLKEITEVIQAEIARRNPHVSFARFPKADQTRFFRPLVRLVQEEQRIDGTRTIHCFEVDFGEHLVGPIISPDGLQIMEAAIRLAARFRTEIVRPFEFARTSNDVTRAQRLLDSIEREAADEGLKNKALVSTQFSGEKQSEVNEMYIRWEKFRNENQDGTLDLAFANNDPAALQICLKELHIMNHRFLELASERYAEMVKFAGS